MDLAVVVGKIGPANPVSQQAAVVTVAGQGGQHVVFLEMKQGRAGSQKDAFFGMDLVAGPENTLARGGQDDHRGMGQNFVRMDEDGEKAWEIFGTGLEVIDLIGGQKEGFVQMELAIVVGKIGPANAVSQQAAVVAVAGQGGCRLDTRNSASVSLEERTVLIYCT